MKIGDFCWVRMKGYPIWPSRIVQHPDLEQQKKNVTKGRQYVYFFGTNNYSWISNERIYPSSDDLINQAKEKKVNSLHKAVEEFISEVKMEQYYERGIVKKCQVVVERMNPETLEKDDIPPKKIQKTIAPVTENVPTDTVLPSTSSEILSFTLDQPPSLRKEVEDELPLSEKSPSVSDNLRTESASIDIKSPVTSSETLSFSPDQSSSLRKEVDELPLSEKSLSVSDNPGTGSASIDINSPVKSSETLSFSPDQSSSLRKEVEDELPLSEKSPSGTESASIDIDSVPSSKKFGFLCEGELGVAFLEYMRKQGHSTESVVDTGSSAAEFFAAHDIIVCCVDKESDVESIFKGEKGIFKSLDVNGGTGKSVVMICNLQLSMSEEIFQAFHKSGGKYLEVRFYGSLFPGNKDYFLLVTGDELVFQECAILFSDKVKYVGSDVSSELEFIVFVEIFFKSFKESHPGFQSLSPEPNELKYREVLILMIEHSYSFCVYRHVNEECNKGMVKYIIRSRHAKIQPRIAE
ncbi:hypothetical protein TNIN_230901 [Trichonephila inaurata madagascariensis]|uniref:PWWP domain-containing protein n=1 Tax=Trichonephila inaurata madagascariensis TaxID=2747483 RepID=A0A8X6XWM2_9ARAC|nr:hypothetical protein TNIN_230901 [Trichonephila inaurata madagascariensis]